MPRRGSSKPPAEPVVKPYGCDCFVNKLFFIETQLFQNYQKVIFRALWITLEPFYFTGFQELSTCQNLSISI